MKKLHMQTEEYNTNPAPQTNLIYQFQLFCFHC